MYKPGRKVHIMGPAKGKKKTTFITLGSVLLRCMVAACRLLLTRCVLVSQGVIMHVDGKSALLPKRSKIQKDWCEISVGSAGKNAEEYSISEILKASGMLKEFMVGTLEERVGLTLLWPCQLLDAIIEFE